MGLDVPFYVTNGNHDVLVQGNEDANQAFEQVALGCTKALAVTGTPTGDADDLLCPRVGDARPPRPPAPVRLQAADQADLRGDGRGAGDDDHGFALVDAGRERRPPAAPPPTTPGTRSQTPGFRFISIDTNSEGGVVGEGRAAPGSSSGNLDDPQFQWLAGELDQAEADGKLVVIFGHHPVRSMNTPITDEEAAQCTGDDEHGHDVNPGCDHDLRPSEPIHLGQPSQATAGQHDRRRPSPSSSPSTRTWSPTSPATPTSTR